MDSLSARLLTDPYTALHEASETAVADTAAQLKDGVSRAIGTVFPEEPPEAYGRINSAVVEHLAPLVARYAHAITGVQTLRALLNAGTLEFSADGTVRRMSELLEQVADLADGEKWDPTDTAAYVLAAIAIGGQAHALLADFRDAQPNVHDTDVASHHIAQTLPKPEPSAALDASEKSIEAVVVALETSVSGKDPAVAVAAVQVARTALEAAEAVLEVERCSHGVALGEHCPECSALAIDADGADGDTELGRGRKSAARMASSFASPFYEVYRADTGKQAPHASTQLYEAALDYCRAGNGTPWHILEVDNQGDAILVTDVKIDGTVVELSDRVPPFHVADPVTVADPADPDPSTLTVPEPQDFVTFTVRRHDDPRGGDFCRTPHYQLALEYCQGSPGVPWEIWQNVAGDAPGVLVTTVDEAGDATEVGERGAP